MMRGKPAPLMGNRYWPLEPRGFYHHRAIHFFKKATAREAARTFTNHRARDLPRARFFGGGDFLPPLIDYPDRIIV